MLLDTIDADHLSATEEQSLAFIAGYVAYTCRDIYPTLDHPATEPRTSRVPDAWINVVNKGACMCRPSRGWPRYKNSTRTSAHYGENGGLSAESQPAAYGCVDQPGAVPESSKNWSPHVSSLG